MDFVADLAKDGSFFGFVILGCVVICVFMMSFC